MKYLNIYVLAIEILKYVNITHLSNYVYVIY